MGALRAPPGRTAAAAAAKGAHATAPAVARRRYRCRAPPPPPQPLPRAAAAAPLVLRWRGGVRAVLRTTARVPPASCTPASHASAVTRVPPQSPPSFRKAGAAPPPAAPPIGLAAATDLRHVLHSGGANSPTAAVTTARIGTLPVIERRRRRF